MLPMLYNASLTNKIWGKKKKPLFFDELLLILNNDDLSRITKEIGMKHVVLACLKAVTLLLHLLKAKE
jgi:hypothetical protein